HSRTDRRGSGAAGCGERRCRCRRSGEAHLGVRRPPSGLTPPATAAIKLSSFDFGEKIGRPPQSQQPEQDSMTPDNTRQTLIIPALGRLYAQLDDSVETLLRVVAGG